MKSQLDLLSVELHELTSVFGHQAMNDRHLFRGEASALLQLVGEAGEDDAVHAAEAHAVVVGDVCSALLIGRLIAEDGEERSLSPAGVSGEFLLQRFEGVLLCHCLYYGGTNEDRQLKYPRLKSSIEVPPAN